MRYTRFSALDLFDRPPLECELVFQTAGEVPTDVDTLAGESGNDSSDARRVAEWMGPDGRMQLRAA